MVFSRNECNTEKICEKTMQRFPDSTQTNMNSTNAENGPTEELRFVKPCPGEVSDGKLLFGCFLGLCFSHLPFFVVVMPMEAEIDSTVAQFEQPQFFIRTYNSDGQLKGEIPLKKYTPLYVGRALGCHIDLVEPSISRRHCAFQYKELIIDALGNTISGFMIYDLKSSHGTFLNEKRIPSMENIKLKHDDKITFGMSTAIFKVYDAKHEVVESAVATERPKSEEAHVPQQPSSTSQPEEIRNGVDSWFVRYMKVLDTLSDMTREFEEQGIQVPLEGAKRKGSERKFKQYNKKFLDQAQVVSSFLTEMLGNEAPDSSPKKQNKRKHNESVVEEDTPKPPPKKRGRKKKVPIEEVETPKEKNSPRKDKKALAEEVLKQIQIQSNPGPSTSEYLLNDTPGFEDGDLLAENNPLSIINGPLLQSNDEESDGNIDNMTLETSQVTSPKRRRSIKKPKRWQNETLLSIEKEPLITTPSIETPPKRGRGRPPKKRKETPQQDLILSPVPAPVAAKRGRKPGPLKATKPLPSVETPAPDFEKPVPKKRGRKPNALKALTKQNSGSQQEDDPQCLEETTISLPSELISVTDNPSPSSSMNGNDRTLCFPMKKSFVLLRKLAFVQSSEDKTT